MRKIGLLFLLLAIGTIAFSQEITVRFTGQLNNSEYCRLDSVAITNLTRNWTETVEYPDTIIVLGGTVGTDLNIAATQGLGQNIPNPFDCETRVELSVAQQEDVRMQLLDASGKQYADFSGSLDAGVHNFDISASMPQTYMLNAMVGSRSYSIRMVNVGRGCGNSIRYAGISGGITAKLTSNNDFQIGDNMRYEGYTTIEEQIETSEAIEQMQAVNQYVTLNFTHYFRPIVETLSATGITTSTATLHGNITNDGGSYCVSRGFYYGTSEDNLSHIITVNTGEGEYSADITGLNIATTYYYCAFATNSAGTSVGEVLSFTTSEEAILTVVTNEATNIMTTRATLSGNVINDGGETVSIRGFLYGTSTNGITEEIQSGNGIGNYTAVITNLTPNTTYYFKAYATNILGTSYGDVMSFTTDGTTGTLDGHDWVDLGLPSGTRWATCNVGATSPEEYGNYYAWGETATKDDYSWGTYQYANGNYNALTKYCDNSDYGYNGFVDNLTTLEPDDDAATINMGQGWRMPTQLEMMELLDFCTATWITQNGTNGMLLTGLNGNSIFLPSAGHYGDGESDNGISGYYWSSFIYVNYPHNAMTLCFFLNGDVISKAIVNQRRQNGYSVRPVCAQ